MQSKQLDSLVEALTQWIPPGLGEMPENLKQNMKQTLASGLEKMDLVSRQEFDVQTGVLAKTRAKLDALEKQVADLEARTEHPRPSQPSEDA